MFARGRPTYDGDQLAMRAELPTSSTEDRGEWLYRWSRGFESAVSDTLSLEVDRPLTGLEKEACRPTGRSGGGGIGSSSGAWFRMGTLTDPGTGEDSRGCITFCANSSKDDLSFLLTMV